MTLIATTALCTLCIGAGYIYGRRHEQQRQAVIATEYRSQNDGTIRNLIELRCAVHEAGHAVIAWHHPNLVRIAKITIDAGSIGMGQVAWSSRKTRDPAKRMWWDITVNLGGIAAEVVEFGKVRSGSAESDLTKAVKLARLLAESGHLEPPWSVKELPKDHFDVASMYRGVEGDAALVLNHCYHQAKRVLTRNPELHSRVTQALIAKGVLEDKDIEVLFGRWWFFA